MMGTKPDPNLPKSREADNLVTPMIAGCATSISSTSAGVALHVHSSPFLVACRRLTAPAPSPLGAVTPPRRSAS